MSPSSLKKLILSVSDLEVINLFSIKKKKLIPKCKNKPSTEFDTQLLCSLVCVSECLVISITACVLYCMCLHLTQTCTEWDKTGQPMNMILFIYFTETGDGEQQQNVITCVDNVLAPLHLTITLHPP